MILQAVKAPLETAENRYRCISVENEKKTGRNDPAGYWFSK